VLVALPDDGATSPLQPGRTPCPAVTAEAIRQIDAILPAAPPDAAVV